MHQKKKETVEESTVEKQTHNIYNIALINNSSKKKKKQNIYIRARTAEIMKKKERKLRLNYVIYIFMTHNSLSLFLSLNMYDQWGLTCSAAKHVHKAAKKGGLQRDQKAKRQNSLQIFYMATWGSLFLRPPTFCQALTI